MVFLKIPIAAMLGLVWWAVRQDPANDPASDDDGGGSKHLPPRPRHPHRTPRPRTPRRGPHGGAHPAPPARMRTVNARARHIAR